MLFDHRRWEFIGHPELKKSVTCKAKQAKSFAKKQIQNAKVQINKAKRTLKTKVTNAITSAKRNLPKIIKSLPAMGGITSIMAIKKEVNSLKDKFYKWADTIHTGFEPNTSMKLQMEQNYTAYLQNNSSYKSSKEYQDAFRNKTLKTDLEIAESQINALLAVLGESGFGAEGSVMKPMSSAKTIPQELTRSGKTPAIGKMRDLNTPGAVGKNEFKVADYLPDKKDPKANWKQNSGILRSVMNEGKPIKDVSMYPMEKAVFLGAERNLLKSKGWTYKDGYWYPPNWE